MEKGDTDRDWNTDNRRLQGQTLSTKLKWVRTFPNIKTYITNIWVKLGWRPRARGVSVGDHVIERCPRAAWGWNVGGSSGRVRPPGRALKIVSSQDWFYGTTWHLKQRDGYGWGISMCINDTICTIHSFWWQHIQMSRGLGCWMFWNNT